MMKSRLSRRNLDEQASSVRSKNEQLNPNGITVPRNQAQLSSNQQTSAQVIRKRRSSINVYDQPSSLNSRLRQLETDMLRLDEDRTKLFDDTHSALAQYELKLNEIHAILKSRQDNVEKYVEDMKSLLQAKEKFEKQAKLLNEKHDRLHEKFMHREITVAREIKLMKNKFELLEKNRQFRSILHKSNALSTNGSNINDDASSGLDPNEFQKLPPSEIGNTSEDGSASQAQSGSEGATGNGLQRSSSIKKSAKNVRIKMGSWSPWTRFLDPLFCRCFNFQRRTSRIASVSIVKPSVDESGMDELELEQQATHMDLSEPEVDTNVTLGNNTAQAFVATSQLT